MLEQLADDVWVHTQALRVMGLRLHTRMTVIRLPGDRLFLHSPVALDAGLRQELDRLGAVYLVVAPNRFHHRYIADYGAFRGVRVFLAPGLAAKLPGLRHEAEFGARIPEGWPGELRFLPIEGAPALGEVAFLHGPSRTLLLTDLLFNIRSAPSPASRLYFELSGAFGRPAQSRLMRLLVRDRGRFAASLLEVLSWDFARVVPCHGDIITEAPRAALEAAWRKAIGGPHGA